MVKFYDFILKYKKLILISILLIFIILLILPISLTKYPQRNKEYVDYLDVARYIKKFHEVPANYITKSGYNYLKDHNMYIDDKYLIGGDTYINQGEFFDYKISTSEPLKECDIYSENYSLKNRNNTRLVYTSNKDNVRVFLTEDHYVSFKEISNFTLQLAANICWIFFGIYLTALTCLIPVLVIAKKKHFKVQYLKAMNNAL